MAKIREVSVSLGMSFETKMEGKITWVKPQVSFTIETEGEEEARDPVARRAIIERAFDVAEEELSAELERLLSEDN